MIAIGGKAVYGAPLGVLMLETRFPRIPGDAGNAETWPFPVHFKIVPGADPVQAVKHGARGLLPDFITAGRELVAMGVEAITTSCGFLTPFQAALAGALKVPVLTSSLMQVPWINAALPPGRQAGVLTIDADSLTPEVLAAAGVPVNTPIEGLPQSSELARVIFTNELRLDVDAARRDMIEAARRLAAEPGVGAIVLECANMPPYAAAVKAATGLPVLSIYDAAIWLVGAVEPRRWGGSTF